MVTRRSRVRRVSASSMMEPFLRPWEGLAGHRGNTLYGYVAENLV